MHLVPGMEVLYGKRVNYDLTIPSGNNTLEGIADFINDASMGSMRVVKSEEANYALVLRSSLGASNVIQLTATEDDAASAFDQLTIQPTMFQRSCTHRLSPDY